MNQRKASARYYLFEDVLWETPGFAGLKKRAPLAQLTVLAGLLWARESGHGSCPVIGRRRKNDASYYLAGNPGRIYLAPKHQCVGGLLHELAHALGHNDKLTHGPAFHARCMRLYKVYGDWSGVVE